MGAEEGAHRVRWEARLAAILARPKHPSNARKVCNWNHPWEIALEMMLALPKRQPANARKVCKDTMAEFGDRAVMLSQFDEETCRIAFRDVENGVTLEYSGNFEDDIILMVLETNDRTLPGDENAGFGFGLSYIGATRGADYMYHLYVPGTPGKPRLNGVMVPGANAMIYVPPFPQLTDESMLEAWNASYAATEKIAGADARRDLDTVRKMVGCGFDITCIAKTFL